MVEFIIYNLGDHIYNAVFALKLAEAGK